MMAITWGVAYHSALFAVSDQVIDHVMSCSQLPDLFLHGIFEDTLLFLDQCSLLLIVCNAFVIPAPVAAPPATPGVFAGGAAVDSHIVAFFAGGGAVGAGP